MTALDTPQVRSSGVSYQELLDDDARPAPDVLRWVSPMPPGPDFVPVARYTTAEFHQLEVEKLWKRVWQMACRDEDIPEVGDHITYDIAGISILVVRSAPGRIQAFHNICLHRGRLLKESSGRDEELRCAFHGFAWNLDGSMKHVRHDMSIMECMFLSPYDESQPKPPSAPIHWLGADDDWTEAWELGLLARVFNQDVFNLPKVQAGLETGAIDTVTFANYQETKPRHMHQLLSGWIARP